VGNFAARPDASQKGMGGPTCRARASWSFWSERRCSCVLDCWSSPFALRMASPKLLCIWVNLASEASCRSLMTPAFLCSLAALSLSLRECYKVRGMR